MDARISGRDTRPEPKSKGVAICSWKNKTTKTFFVAELHSLHHEYPSITLFLFGGLFRLLCRGLLRRHVFFTPFHR